MPLQGMCAPVLTARRLCRDGAVVLRTHGTVLKAADATGWTAELPRTFGVLAVSSRASGTRATVLAVERFYTSDLLIRERATEGLHASTLTMKES